MKKNLAFIICALLFSVPVFAQEVTEIEEIATNEVVVDEPETQSSILFNGSPYNFIFNWQKKPNESHWTGLGFAFANLAGLEDVDLKLSRSYSINLNLVDYAVPLSHHWLFATGLGFDWSRFHFKGNAGLQEIDGVFRFVTESDKTYKDSKLLVYYATVPFIFEYQTKISKGRHFFIHGGVEGLIKCYSRSQVDIKMAEGVEKTKNRDLNLLPLNARLIVRTGFDNFSFFGYYQPFSMFEKGKGPDMKSWGIGISLN